jgi:hypothetical protein
LPLRTISLFDWGWVSSTFFGFLAWHLFQDDFELDFKY